MGIEIDYLQAGAGGAYWERMLMKNSVQRTMPGHTPEEAGMAEEVREKLSGVTITMSPESAEYMKRLEARKEEERAQQARFQRENSPLVMQDPFSRIGTQFSTISKALSEMGYYDDLSDEEVLETDKLLANITYGMNSICGNFRVETETRAPELSSYAAKFELESSTAALRQFADKYLPENMRETFQNLVDKYYEHNSMALEGYRSTREIMDELQANTYDKVASSRVIPMSEEEKMTHLAGKVKPEDEDVNSAYKEWRTYFKMFAQADHPEDDVMAKLSESLNRLASGNSENKRFVQFIANRNAFAIENARLYWSALI